MKIKKYILDKWKYAPEMTRLYMIVNEDSKIEITKHYSIEELNKIDNYQDLLRYIRKTNKSIFNGKKVRIDIKNSYDKFENKTFRGTVNDYQEILDFISAYNQLNGGEQSVIVGYDKDTDSFRYDTIVNEIEYNIKFII